MSNLPGSWQSFLPKSYHWIAKLAAKETEALTRDAWNIVPVSKDSAGKSLTFGNSLLHHDEQKALEQAMTEAAWDPADRPWRTVLNGIPYLLIAEAKPHVNPVQSARQFGFDVAAALQKATKKVISLAGLSNHQALDVFEGYFLGLDDGGYFRGSPSLDLAEEVYLEADDLKGFESRRSMVQSVIFTKWLQDSPPNWLNSEQLAQIVSEHFRDRDGVSIEILGREAMQEAGMGCFLSVAQGSTVDPKLITVRFSGERSDKTVALVGKGVTFDAGGINLKPTQGLEEMKYDMSGAAAVLGAAHYFATQKPPVNVVCAIGAVENMPSGTATRPGDIVKSLSGKTVEIGNTDAEGRLVLADVLTYTIQKSKPQLVLDIATLTGAVIFGLGHAGAAFLTDKPSLAPFLNGISERYGEAAWQLPLWPELEAEVASELADIKNLPKPNVKAGTIMGAWFLREFVKDERCDWAHIDIAGTAWNCSASGYHKAGGSAFGTRLLIGAALQFDS